MFDVAHVGILVADVIAKTVDTIPGKGKLGLINSLDLRNGGCAMTAAVNMATIGRSTAILGKIGKDGFGSYLKGVLQEAGVDTNGLIEDEKAATSASVALVDGGGERTFLHCRGANAEFTEEDIDYTVIGKANIVFVAGTMLMPAFDGRPCATFLQKARAMGKITTLDTAWDATGSWMKTLAPCMPHIDYFLPSYEEAVCFAGGKEDPEDIAKCFFDMGVKTVVIKLGAEGCFLKEHKDAGGIRIPAYKVDAVDTTGAGDSFCSGFLTGLAMNLPLKDCCELGMATGALCVTATGATTGMKPYAEILSFMASRR